MVDDEGAVNGVSPLLEDPELIAFCKAHWNDISSLHWNVWCYYPGYAG